MGLRLIFVRSSPQQYHQYSKIGLKLFPSVYYIIILSKRECVYCIPILRRYVDENGTTRFTRK